MPEGFPGLLRYRVINRVTGAEITKNLPHLNASTWTIVGYQPGNPASTMVGSFTLPLHPPGSDLYAAAKAIYDQLDYFLRIEAYISPDGASIGKLKFAGIITGIEKAYGKDGDTFELTGVTDLGLANYSRPFPGEILSNDVTSKIIQSYMGMNELGWTDTFTPFTSGNYFATDAHSWSGTTDDGFNVVTPSGTSALIAQTGAKANDRWHSHYIEATGRFQPSNDTVNAGQFGVGISKNTGNRNDCILGLVTAYKAGGRYHLNATLNVYVAGVVQAGSQTVTNVLVNVDDAQGFIPVTVGLLANDPNVPTLIPTVSLIVNGKMVQSIPSGYDPTTGTTQYPLLWFGQAVSGTAHSFMTNLTQITRFTADGPSTASVFAPGSITTTTHSLHFGTDPGPTFLEIWGKMATRESYYLRYNPQAFVSGVRTLGTLDFAADPGIDRSNSVIFRRALGNLISLRMSANAESFAAGTTSTATASPDGGGLGYWRDIGSMTKYGVIEDQVLAMTASDFQLARRFAFQIVSNKINASVQGAKTAVVLRDATTVDQWRELDRVTIDDPELGISNLTARIIGYTFTENDPFQTIYLDQFSRDFLVV